MNNKNAFLGELLISEGERRELACLKLQAWY